MLSAFKFKSSLNQLACLRKYFLFSASWLSAVILLRLTSGRHRILLRCAQLYFLVLLIEIANLRRTTQDESSASSASAAATATQVQCVRQAIAVAISIAITIPVPISMGTEPSHKVSRLQLQLQTEPGCNQAVNRSNVLRFLRADLSQKQKKILTDAVKKRVKLNAFFLDLDNDWLFYVLSFIKEAYFYYRTQFLLQIHIKSIDPL